MLFFYLAIVTSQTIQRLYFLQKIKFSNLHCEVSELKYLLNMLRVKILYSKAFVCKIVRLFGISSYSLLTIVRLGKKDEAIKVLLMRLRDAYSIMEIPNTLAL